MAESPQSPSEASVARDLDVVSENAGTASTDANSMEVNFNRSDAEIELQVPATSQMKLKPPYLSASSSETDTDDSELATQSGDEFGSVTSRPSTSPPLICAICLSRCKNKCHTDACMHQSCFNCLREWSKVKPECPLCKQTFKTIIHNFKSTDQFEEHHVQPANVQTPHRPVNNSSHLIGLLGIDQAQELATQLKRIADIEAERLRFEIARFKFNNPDFDFNPLES